MPLLPIVDLNFNCSQAIIYVCIQCILINIETQFENESVSHSVISDSLQPHGLLYPWNSPGKNTRVGSHPLLQGIFPTQGLNLGLLHCRQILHHLSHQGSPNIPSGNDSKAPMLLSVTFVSYLHAIINNCKNFVSMLERKKVEH